MSTVIGRLEAEWEHVVTASTEVFEQLRRAEEALGSLDDLGTLMAALARRDHDGAWDRHDEILLALLRQAQRFGPIGDLTARTVVQALLPGVKSLLSNPWLAQFEPPERPGLVLAELHIQIRAPRSPWGPRGVAAQVLGRTRDRFRPSRSAAEAYERLGGDESEIAEPTVSAGEQLILLLSDAVRSALISPSEAKLIAEIRVAGRSRKEVAVELGIGPGALGRRLQLAEARLRRAVDEAA